MNGSAETVGHRIRKIRGSLSQVEFAAKIGVNKNLVGKYERDENIPGGDILTRMHEALCVDITWLLTGQCFSVSHVSNAQDQVPSSRPFEQSAKIDDALMGEVSHEISAVYDEEGVDIAPVQMVRLATGVYNDLVGLGQEERFCMLKGVLAQLRRDLRQPPSSFRDGKLLV